MTRLEEAWITNMKANLSENEKDLFTKTGLTYRELARRISGLSAPDFDRELGKLKFAAVTMTSGLGEIGSFAESVKGILEQIGVEAFIPAATDTAGIYEATRFGANGIFMADDHRFIALNLMKNKVGENNEGTGLGYVEILSEIMGREGVSFADEEVLVIGFGPVGRIIGENIALRGGRVVYFDHAPEKMNELEKENKRFIKTQEEMNRFPYIIDASSSGAWVEPEMLHPKCWYVTPGVPLSLTGRGRELLQSRLIHDLLEIGVASMLGLAL